MKIIVLEDEKAVADKLCDYIGRYCSESNVPVEVQVFPDAFELLENYHADADILFMDIQLPVMNGMEAAKKIRGKDDKVLIVFVTNLAQYAVEGYEVNAFDFILKPLEYEGFRMRFGRVLKELEHRSPDSFININSKSGFRRISFSDLLYVEVINHDLIFHCREEGEVQTRGTMKRLAEELKDEYFVQCSNCYLVNLAHVKQADRMVVLSDGTELAISAMPAKTFLPNLPNTLGELYDCAACRDGCGGRLRDVRIVYDDAADGYGDTCR